MVWDANNVELLECLIVLLNGEGGNDMMGVDTEWLVGGKSEKEGDAKKAGDTTIVFRAWRYGIGLELMDSSYGL